MTLQELEAADRALRARAALRIITLADIRDYGMSRVWGYLRDHHTYADCLDALRLAYYVEGLLIPFGRGVRDRRNNKGATPERVARRQERYGAAGALAWADGWAAGGER